MLGWVREVLAGMAEGALPGETRAVWEREGDGEVRRTEGYALTSLGPNEADAGVLGRLWLGRWGVENGSFWVRDVLLREDASQVRGRGGEVLAVLRAHLVSWLNRKGIRRKKAALEAFSFNPMAALRFLGLYAV
ncbi:DDE transposase family protein [Thermus caliditerrae]|uniref:DDE transposase family protein n=1 Tax=Thermus caliditerrae TaxID=1330700 RepID=UPI000AEF6ED1|nr:DDE transposase family protein [Thermus caliditerrae]